VAGNKAYREVLYSIKNLCEEEPQVITLAELGTKQLSFNKNLGLQSLFSEAEINALFVLEDPTKCPLEQFDILLSDGSVLSSENSLYSRLDLSNRPADMSL